MMKIRYWKSRRLTLQWLLAVGLIAGGPCVAWGQFVVPGTGQKMTDASDNFEDDSWSFTANYPKSSQNLDKRSRDPIGFSSNSLWFESPKRGAPEEIKRVPTPAGGLPGSKGALMLRSLQTGVPGRPSFTGQQDDLIMDMTEANGGSIPVSRSPSIVVRVFLPPFEEWEDATDTSFGLRASVTGIGPVEEKKRRLFSRRKRTRITRKVDVFYPGMFIQFNSKTDPSFDEDSAVFIIRGDDWGGDFLGPKITKTGWWTLGMSFTPDGRVHYFAKPGVDDLTAKDHIASHFSQSVHCQYFNTIFFNVCNQDTGRSWSTRWIIDDPTLYQAPNYREARRSSSRR